MAVEVELTRVLIRETDDTHVVELKEKDGSRVFPIMIGIVEAAAIERRLMGQVPPRPQTHELLESVVQEVGWRLDHVMISDLQDHTFFAKIVLGRGEERVEIDARPSDAIALACASEAGIYVTEAVLDMASRPES